MKIPTIPLCECTQTRIPAGTSFPLLAIGQAHPLCCHSADVVVGVKVGLLNLARVYHVNDVIDGDAVREEEENGKKKRLE